MSEFKSSGSLFNCPVFYYLFNCWLVGWFSLSSCVMGVFPPGCHLSRTCMRTILGYPPTAEQGRLRGVGARGENGLVLDLSRTAWRLVKGKDCVYSFCPQYCYIVIMSPPSPRFVGILLDFFNMTHAFTDFDAHLQCEKHCSRSWA